MASLRVLSLLTLFIALQLQRHKNFDISINHAPNGNILESASRDCTANFSYCMLAKYFRVSPIESSGIIRILKSDMYRTFSLPFCTILISCIYYRIA